jgi:hypothetical protein
MTSHKLTDEYVQRVARFAGSFPTAHTFLRRLETEGPAHGSWLSTAVNAHLYKGAAYLAYLKLKNPELKPPSLVISPRFNQQIAAHTSDQSTLLFPRPFDDLVAAHGGFRERWAVRHTHGATELTVSAMPAFFDAIYDAVAKLAVPGA